MLQGVTQETSWRGLGLKAVQLCVHKCLSALAFVGCQTVWESTRLNLCGKRTSRNVPSNVISIVYHSSLCPVLPAIKVIVRAIADMAYRDGAGSEYWDLITSGHQLISAMSLWFCSHRLSSQKLALKRWLTLLHMHL